MIMKIGTNGVYLFQETKITKFCKMLGKKCKTGVTLLFSKILQNSFIVIYSNQTTIKTSTLPAICIFKKSNPIL